MAHIPVPASVVPLARVLAHARAGLAILLGITLGLLAWHHYGMQRTIELTGDSFVQGADDDRSAGGASIAALERRGKDLLLHCRIAAKHPWPYCKLIFSVAPGRPGIDLSGLDQIIVDMTHHGTGKDLFGVVIVNDEAGLTRPDDWKTYKVNEVTGLELPQHGPVAVPLKWFGVAQWWKELARPPLDHSYAQMDNVIRIELLTQAGIPPGDHLFEIRSVRLRGKLVSDSALLVGLVALWIMAAIAWPAATALVLRGQLHDSNTALARQREISQALELETRELAGQAHIDPLTGVLNREGLRAALLDSSNLLADPMSVVFIDIDNFKRINDAQGHDVGDEVLRVFARVIGAEIRSSDRLVRWGGEEFLLVCPMTDVHHAVALAEKLRAALHRQAWPTGLALTASFGVAQHDTTEDIGVVVKRADRELYRAKASGRDRVQAYIARQQEARAVA